MNKKFLSAILFGALVASTGSFVSCADNDAEIKQLQDQNSDLKAQLAALKTELQAELKSAASASQVAAIEAKLSAIESATADNMKATVDALNGKFDTQEAKIVAINTQLKALEGLQGVDASELISALEKAKENGGGDISSLSAMVDALDAQVNTLLSELKSLVFQPEFYLDGIEAAEYTYLQYAVLDPKGDIYAAVDKNGDYVTVDDKGNNNKKSVNNLGNTVTIDYADWQYFHEGEIVNTINPTPADKEFGFTDTDVDPFDQYFALVADKKIVPIQERAGKNIIKFAMNPSNANVDDKDMSVVTKTICAVTRSAETAIQILSSEKKDGYLYVTYSIDPKYLITAKNYLNENKNDKNILGEAVTPENTTIIKLRANVDSDVTVESDWAALYESYVQPVAYGLNDKAWGAKKGKDNYYKHEGDTIAEYLKNPYVALNCEPILGVDYEGSIDLKEYVNVHFVKKAPFKKEIEKNTIHVSLTIDQAEQLYNLKTTFNMVDYKTEVDDKDGNSNFTEPNKYVKLDGSVLKPGHVNADGSFNEAPGESSIGKQPLVQVIMKDEEGRVVLDAYIHLIITRQIKPVATATIDLGAKDFACTQAWTETWAQQSKLVLQDENVKMSKEEFEKYYELVFDDMTKKEEVSLFNDKYALIPTDKRFVYATQHYDGEGTTNAVINFDIKAWGEQYLYELNENHEATVYVKYQPIAKSGQETGLPYVMVPFRIAINNITPLVLGKKIAEYWYANDGTIAGTPDEAIRFNVNYPKDNGQTAFRSILAGPISALTADEKAKSFMSDIVEAWVDNKVQFFGADNKATKDVAKYYFHPETNKVVVAGKYYLSVESDNVTCVIWNNGKWTESSTHGNAAAADKPAEFGDKISAQENSIKYTQDLEAAHMLDAKTGMYKNLKLYATTYKTVDGKQEVDAKEAIAELDENTGEIWYYENDLAKEVLNATSHNAAEAKAYVGVYTTYCDDYVRPVADNVFPVYFLRPLTLIAPEDKEGTDAVANGQFVTLFDKFNFMDWRDVKFVDGTDYTNIWLAAYYNVNSLTVDLKNVKTSMVDTEGNSINVIPATVKLSYVNENGVAVATSNAEPTKGTITKTLSAYNKASMGVQSTYDALVKHFGQIKYENNGTNVQDFWVEIPVEFGYDWGTMKSTIKIYLKGTMANS